jgi:hypothetical protein
LGILKNFFKLIEAAGYPVDDDEAPSFEDWLNDTTTPVHSPDNSPEGSNASRHGHYSGLFLLVLHIGAAAADFFSCYQEERA